MQEPAFWLPHFDLDNSILTRLTINIILQPKQKLKSVKSYRDKAKPRISNLTILKHTSQTSLTHINSET